MKHMKKSPDKFNSGKDSQPKVSIKRRDALKSMMLLPAAGYSLFTENVFGGDKAGTMNIHSSLKPFPAMAPKPEDWYKFCRPAMEWLNPYPELNVEEYAEDMIRLAKEMNLDTLYHLIDFGGAPLFNGSIEPKAPEIGAGDLIGTLERRLHEEGMYFVGAQFGSHTQSTLAERHPEWIARTPDQKPIYGPGGVPLLCFNTGYREYVGDELALMVSKYMTDGLYIEGLHNTNCYCPDCAAKFLNTYGKSIPSDSPGRSMENARFRMDTVTGFIESIYKKVKNQSANTIVMACPSNNNNAEQRVDWKKLGSVCDVITLERMWGNDYIYPIWQQGMNVGVMIAEGKKSTFTTAWYAMHVDREYTPRTKETLSINYLESLIHGATVQFHTQNGPGEVPDNIPVLNELYSYTEKIRPWFLGAEKINPVSLLYDRDHYYPENHFAGYYKALIHNHIQFRVISRDELTKDYLKTTRVLVLPNVINISEEENIAISEFTRNGGVLVATYKTGFQDESNSSSVLAGLFGIKEYLGERKTAGLPGPGETRLSPSHYRKDWNLYFRCREGSYAQKAGGFSLLTFRGSLLKTRVEDDTEALANIIETDKSRQSARHPVYGFYPGEASNPIMTERNFGKGKVVYFAGNLENDYYAKGNAFVARILCSPILREELPVIAEAPDTVEISCFQTKESNKLLIHVLNMTTNQRLNPDSVNRIFPVSGILLRIKGGRTASSLTDDEPLILARQGDYLIVKIDDLELIQSIIVES
jgi:hypothetical protein